MKKKTLHFNSITIHGGQTLDPAYGSVMTPIYQTSTYAQKSPGVHQGFEYSRSANPTRSALESSLAALENGSYGLAFASGLAAIDAVLKLLKPGDHILASHDLYGGSYRLFVQMFESFGLSFSFVDMQELTVVKKAITAETRLIWLETPTNPLMTIVDIKGVAALIEGLDILLAVDNTFASPYLQQPLNLG
ncbi:MAG: PLP-dependent transferase, partial [Flavobacteriaceae bacterium]